MGKKFLIFASILAFVSCAPTPKEFDNALKAGIDNAESLVNDYDLAVLEALEKNIPDTITPLTETALFGLVKTQQQIKESKASTDGQQLKKAAEDYIEALINFVKTQNLYASYSDSLPESEAQSMDKTCSDALSTVKMLRSKLTDYQKAFAREKGLYENEE